MELLDNDPKHLTYKNSILKYLKPVWAIAGFFIY
jgi:hypothetical protein